MEPTLKHGDLIVIERLSVFLGLIDRGDIVVFNNVRESKNEKKKVLLKRVVALPYEKVRVEGKQVLIIDQNGIAHTLNDDYASMTYSNYMPDKTTYLGKEDFFVTGDNRSYSEDSRKLGTVQPQEMIGTFLINLW
jgi:signal peptidase I